VAPGARPGYAFGDTPAASVRLDLLAAVFAPTSVALLGEVAAGAAAPARLVLDLGCGPGHTTAMLAEAFPSACVVGLDTSHPFVAEGAAGAGASGPRGRCRFALADATRLPLPCAPADVVYARFLLVHLSDPGSLVGAWAGELRPGGLAVVEEPERIDTHDPDFTRYLELAAAVVADRGGDLYAGRQLVGLAPPPGSVRVVDRAAPLEVAAGAAAGIFALNLATWGDDPALAGLSQPGETASLLERLRRRRHDPSRGVIRWHMRQWALQRQR
jgi:SAM-dependent methyltransferase